MDGVPGEHGCVGGHGWVGGRDCVDGHCGGGYGNVGGSGVDGGLVETVEMPNLVVGLVVVSTYVPSCKVRRVGWPSRSILRQWHVLKVPD